MHIQIPSDSGNKISRAFSREPSEADKAERLRAKAANRIQRFTTQLYTLLPFSTQTSFSRPQGGFFIGKKLERAADEG